MKTTTINVLDIVQHGRNIGVVIGVYPEPSSKYGPPEGGLYCLTSDASGAPCRLRFGGGEFFSGFSLHDYDGSLSRTRRIGRADRAAVEAAIAEIDAQAPTGGTGQLYRATVEARRIGLLPPTAR